MLNTPKSLRLQIGIFGRTNVGKSSFLNFLAGQDVAITSPIPGTTTDVVEKAMELLPLGPVLFLDTAGLDDRSELAEKRLEKTKKILGRSDIVLLVTEPNVWTEFESAVIQEARERKLPVMVIINQSDRAKSFAAFMEQIQSKNIPWLETSCVTPLLREKTLVEFKRILLQLCPAEFLTPPPLVGDLVPAGGLVVLVVPIDLEAPKGRLILPQVQTIRDVLDQDAAVMVVKEREYRAYLERLRTPPDLVVCDSQVVLKMVADTPPSVRCTTFSVLFSRLKGDLAEMVRGVFAVDHLKAKDRVLVSEACTHHALEDDIGRVKIPRWIRQYLGRDVEITTVCGHDYPEDLKDYQWIVHCGACMLGRREMLGRLEEAKQAGVPITNYGVCISYLQGVLGRVLSPFPGLIELYESYKESIAGGKS